MRLLQDRPFGAMTMDKNTNGMGFVGFLTIAFIVLKLTENIDWSWWWVLSPIWITAAVVAVVMFVGAWFGSR